MRKFNGTTTFSILSCLINCNNFITSGFDITLQLLFISIQALYPFTILFKYFYICSNTSSEYSDVKVVGFNNFHLAHLTANKKRMNTESMCMNTTIFLFQLFKIISVILFLTWNGYTAKSITTHLVLIIKYWFQFWNLYILPTHRYIYSHRVYFYFIPNRQCRRYLTIISKQFFVIQLFVSMLLNVSPLCPTIFALINKVIPTLKLNSFKSLCLNCPLWNYSNIMSLVITRKLFHFIWDQLFYHQKRNITSLQIYNH